MEIGDSEERMAEDTAGQEAHRLGALTMAEAARRLGVPTREIVDIPEDALQEYAAKAS